MKKIILSIVLLTVSFDTYAAAGAVDAAAADERPSRSGSVVWGSDSSNKRTYPFGAYAQLEFPDGTDRMAVYQFEDEITPLMRAKAIIPSAEQVFTYEETTETPNLILRCSAATYSGDMGQYAIDILRKMNTTRLGEQFTHVGTILLQDAEDIRLRRIDIEREEDRGKKTGSLAMIALLKHLKKNPFTAGRTLRLEVGFNSDRLVPWYLKFGFKVDSIGGPGLVNMSLVLPAKSKEASK